MGVCPLGQQVASSHKWISLDVVVVYHIARAGVITLSSCASMQTDIGRSSVTRGDKQNTIDFTVKWVRKRNRRRLRREHPKDSSIIQPSISWALIGCVDRSGVILCVGSMSQWSLSLGLKQLTHPPGPHTACQTRAPADSQVIPVCSITQERQRCFFQWHFTLMTAYCSSMTVSGMDLHFKFTSNLHFFVVVVVIVVVGVHTTVQKFKIF